ncbi:MAG TPA: VanZ family protein [Gemmatimonadales bacterium]|nr:VanZ family protein [Gemmatimonadales bacterium]
MGAERTDRGWLAVWLWLALQLTLTSLPGKAIPVGLPHPVDWVGHFCMYGGLGALLARAAFFRGWRLKHLVWLGVALSAWAALDELHQRFIPGRDCEVGDWAADTIGASLGLWVGTRLMTSRVARWLR